MRCLVLQVSLHEVHDITAEINGFTVSQLAHLSWLRAIVLLDLGTGLIDLKRGRVHHSIYIGA